MSDKILVVDDDPVICEVLEFNLANEDFDIVCVHSAEEAMQKLSPDYSLIILDVMLGGISGYKFAESLRRKSNQIPIIFLTAKDTENDMLTGFSVGADDYVSKPFSIKEVVARVKAVLKRRPAQKENEGDIVFDDIIINSRLKEIIIGKERIMLTKTEYGIMRLLAENPQRIFSRDDIIEIVWKESPYITERTVDVHITRLRKKLGKKAGLISNRPGFGYRFNAFCDDEDKL
ncbi:MAG: response regulator transcription factor [Prevotellaceae bacterium]|jgi:DNA-binding response OmpR family regulator|nr:response regulator transcription factor [Prevotellaceae bacterium]